MEPDDVETTLWVTWETAELGAQESGPFHSWGAANDYCEDLPGAAMKVRIETRNRYVGGGDAVGTGGTFEFFWPVRGHEIWTDEAVGSLVGQRPRFDIAGEPAGLLTVVAATKAEGGIKLRVRRDGGHSEVSDTSEGRS